MNAKLVYRRLLLLGVPLALGMLELFHPAVHGSNIFADVKPQVEWWTILHLVQLPLAGLLGVAVLVLLSDLDSVSAAISRIGVWLFVVFFSALDAIAGIATGLAIQHAATLPDDEQQSIVLLVNGFHFSPVADLIGRLAMLGWIVAVTTAALALAQRGVSRVAVALLAFSLLFAIHPPPTGPLGMLSFFLAVLWIEFPRGNS